jgi:hypothetical protein
MDSKPALGGMVDLAGVSDVMVQGGSHVATYFNSEPGRLRIAAPFLRDGILLGQPCFLIASGQVLERYIEALEKDTKKELAAAKRRGLFATAPTPGRTVEEALAFWDGHMATAMASFRPTVIRIVGDMACVKAAFSSVHHMLMFERRLGAILTRSPAVAVCQYDVREFDGPELLEAIKAHPDVSNLGFVKFVS